MQSCLSAMSRGGMRATRPRFRLSGRPRQGIRPSAEVANRRAPATRSAPRRRREIAEHIAPGAGPQQGGRAAGACNCRGIRPRATAMPAAGAAASAAARAARRASERCPARHASSRQVRQTTIVTGPDEAGGRPDPKGCWRSRTALRVRHGVRDAARIPRRAADSNRPRAPRPAPARLADGRSPGSRVIAGAHLPGHRPVAFGRGSSLTVAGTAAAWNLARSHRIPSSPSPLPEKDRRGDVTRRSARLSTRPAPVCGRSNIRL